MTGVRILALVALFVAALGFGWAQAETFTSTSTTVGADGLEYTYSNTYDDASGISLEKLVRTNADGSTTIVASLRSDAEGNWTGQIDGVSYQDQYSELLGDYVVIQGADVWPTWEHFDAALWSLTGWGGADLIGIDPMPIEIMILSASADMGSGNGGTVTSNHRLHGTENALMRTGVHGSVKAGSVLFKLWAKGVGSPQPPAGANGN